MMTFMTCFRGWDIWKRQNGIVVEYYIRIADDMDFEGSFVTFEDAIENIIAK